MRRAALLVSAHSVHEEVISADTLGESLEHYCQTLGVPPALLLSAEALDEKYNYPHLHPHSRYSFIIERILLPHTTLQLQLQQQQQCIS